MTLWPWRKRCRELEAQNQQLRERNASLQRQVEQLQAQNTQLVQALAAAKKDSGTSSKPPSSDIVKKAPPRRRGSRRRIGAQKGHPKHEREPFPPQRVDQRLAYRLTHCPLDPAHRIAAADHRQRVVQQVELVAQPFVVTEHTAYGIWCEDCHQYHDAPLPAEVLAGGLCGPRLTSLVAYLKGKLHGSYSGIQDLLAQVVGLQVSRGYLVKLLHKASAAFAQPCAQLIRRLPQEKRLNIDETGHKENGQRHWTWCFRALNFVVFHIAASRGSEVLTQLLGEEFQGILGCDFYAAYRKYAKGCGLLIQFCLAHLIRDVKYLCEFPDPTVGTYGQKLLAGLRTLFGAFHRQDQLSPQGYSRALASAQEQIWEAALEPRAQPQHYPGGKPHRLIRNMANRFYHHGKGYFQFISSPGVEPTNNCCEQAMRFVVMDRHMTQGTRGPRGRLICERLWTVLATCSRQQRPAFDWFCQAISAHFRGLPPPSLLTDSS